MNIVVKLFASEFDCCKIETTPKTMFLKIRVILMLSIALTNLRIRRFIIRAFAAKSTFRIGLKIVLSNMDIH